MTVLQLAANRWWTGSADSVLALVRALRERGHRVMLAITRGERFEAKAREAGVELLAGLVLDARVSPLAAARDLAALRRIVRDEGVEVIHAHHSHDHWLAALAGREAALVRTFHNAGAVKAGAAGRWLHRRTAAALAVSAATEARCLAAGFGRDRVWPLRGVTDVARFAAAASGRAIRDEFKLGGAPVVGCVARLAPRRGHRELLAGFRELLGRVPAARLLLVGKGEARAALEAAVAEMGLGERAIFAGYRDRDLPEVLAALDCFVLMAPGSDESCRAVLEAMAAGRPVVARRLGALPETVLHGETGLLLDDDRPASVADALAALLGDPDRARAMGGGGRRPSSPPRGTRRTSNGSTRPCSPAPERGRRDGAVALGGAGRGRAAMKISVLCFDLSDNATGRADLLARLLAPRHEVEVVGPLFGAELWKPAQGGPVPHVGVRGGRYPGFAARVPELLRRIDGALIYASKPRATSFGIGLLRHLATRRPLLLDIDDWELGFFYRSGFWGRAGRFLNLSNPNGLPWTWLMERLVPLASALTVGSRFLQARFGGTLIPHVRDTDAWRPERYDPGEARARLGAGDRRIVMFLGTPRGYKGVEDLVEAVRLLGRPDVLLALVGVGSRYPAGPGVRTTPEIPFDEVPRYLAAADVVAVPQRATPDTEGQVPAKIFDAMALARPVVSTRVSMIPEILDGCGVVVDPGDPKALAAAIARLLDDPAHARELGARGRVRCEGLYSFSAARARLFPLVDSLCADPGRGHGA